jgi:hypothetical protein
MDFRRAFGGEHRLRYLFGKASVYHDFADACLYVVAFAWICISYVLNKNGGAPIADEFRKLLLVGVQGSR